MLDGRCFDVSCQLGSYECIRKKKKDSLFNLNFNSHAINLFVFKNPGKKSIETMLKNILVIILVINTISSQAGKAGFTHANFVGRFLKSSKQSQAKNRFNAMTSPILKNL